MTIGSVASGDAQSVSRIPTLVASQQEAQKEAQAGEHDGDEPLVGGNVNKLA